MPDAWRRRPLLGVAIFALIRLLISLPLIGGPAWQRDELMFMACGQHLSLGYVDDPPLVAWLCRLSYELFGYAAWGLRLWASLSSAAVVFLTAKIAQKLGASESGQLLSAAAVALAPAYALSCINIGVFSYEPLWWCLLALFLLEYQQNGHSRWLWLAGLAAGCGLLTKFTMGLWMLCLAAGILGTPQRRWFKQPALYGSVAVASAFLLPSLYWWSQHEWSGWLFLCSASQGDSGVGLGGFWLGQIIYQHLLAAPVWIMGALFLMRRRSPARYLGWGALFYALILSAVHTPIRYLSPLFPLLLAAGGAAWESLAKPRIQAQKALRACALSLSVLALGLTYVALRPQAYNPAFYGRALSCGLYAPTPEASADKVMENFYIQPKWRKRAEFIADIYAQLPPELRQSTLFYSEDGALTAVLDMLNGELDLPPTYCASYTPYYWEPRLQAPQVIISAHCRQRDREVLRRYFPRVQSAEARQLAPIFEDAPCFRVEINTSPKPCDIEQMRRELRHLER